MIDRDRIAATLGALADARARNDNDEVQRYFAPGARYALAANHSLLVDMHVEPGDAERAVAELISTYQFHDIQALEMIIDGNKAATRWRISVSLEGGAPVQTDLCDIWTFNDVGKITDIQEFADTAQIAALFRARD